MGCLISPPSRADIALHVKNFSQIHTACKHLHGASTAILELRHVEDGIISFRTAGLHLVHLEVGT